MKMNKMSVAVMAALSLASVPQAAFAARATSTSVDRDVNDAMRSIGLKVKLINKLGADALGISVTVVGDTATLSGDVEKVASQKLAKQVALSIRGVRKVESQITLKEPTTPSPVVAPTPSRESAIDDAMLELKVRSMLLTAVGANAFKIDVTSVDGVISLRGAPDDRDAARAAIPRVKKIKGVKDVVDLLN